MEITPLFLVSLGMLGTMLVCMVVGGFFRDENKPSGSAGVKAGKEQKHHS